MISMLGLYYGIVCGVYLASDQHNAAKRKSANKETFLKHDWHYGIFSNFAKTSLRHTLQHLTAFYDGFHMKSKEKRRETQIW